MKNLKDSITHISKESNILAVIGIVNPKLGIPFISIEQLIDGSGENNLEVLLEGKNIKPVESKGNKQVIFKDLCIQIFRKS